MPELLEATRPLGDAWTAPARQHGSAASVLMVERPIASAFVVRFPEDDGEAVRAIATKTGLILAPAVRFAESGIGVGLWLGPGDWLLVVAGTEDDLAAALETSQPERWAAAVASDAWFRVRLLGACSPSLLAKGTAIDVDPVIFAANAAAVTRFARIRALIHRVDAGTTYDLYVERSFATYLWAWLMDAMEEFV